MHTQRVFLTGYISLLGTNTIYYWQLKQQIEKTEDDSGKEDLCYQNNGREVFRVVSILAKKPSNGKEVFCVVSIMAEKPSNGKDVFCIVSIMAKKSSALLV